MKKKAVIPSDRQTSDIQLIYLFHLSFLAAEQRVWLMLNFTDSNKHQWEGLQHQECQKE